MNKAQPAPQDLLNLWDRVVLALDKYGVKSEFVSRIEDIKRDSYVLEMPIRQSGELHLQKGDIVEVTYSRRDAAYSFKASILDLFEGEDKSIRIEKRSGTTRAQRRKYVRLDISGKMHFRTIDLGAQENIGAEVGGTLLNISAGGVLFESQARINEKGFLILSFALKGKHALSNILAVVKRCEGSRTKGYLIGAEFISRHNLADYDLEHIDQFLPPGAGTFDDNLQKLVVQFIYNQQIESRKKGLLNG
jgi:c-di-GMP-binding flagellar brake protein YcgR